MMETSSDRLPTGLHPEDQTFSVTFSGPAISRDMAFLQKKLGKDAVGVVRFCVSCMASQLGADLQGSGQ